MLEKCAIIVCAHIFNFILICSWHSGGLDAGPRTKVGARPASGPAMRCWGPGRVPGPKSAKNIVTMYSDSTLPNTFDIYCAMLSYNLRCHTCYLA